MQSFASLQHCLLSLAFQSTNQIILWHLQGLLSLQERLLPFWVSTIFQSLSFKSWHFFIFSLSFSLTLTSAGTAISMINPFRSFLSIKILSGLLAPITLSHWTSIFHNTFTSSFSTAPSGTCSYHFFVCSNPLSFTKVPMDFLCYTVVSSLIFFLSQFLTST